VYQPDTDAAAAKNKSLEAAVLALERAPDFGSSFSAASHEGFCRSIGKVRVMNHQLGAMNPQIGANMTTQCGAIGNSGSAGGFHGPGTDGT